jgi:hypothetical protein
MPPDQPNPTQPEPPQETKSTFTKADMLEVLKTLPHEVRQLAGKAPDHWGISMQCLAATALAHMAAAVGRFHCVVTAGCHKAAPFNLIVTGSEQVNQGRWIEALGQPWLESAQRIEDMQHRPTKRESVAHNDDFAAHRPGECFAEAALRVQKRTSQTLTKIHGALPGRLKSMMGNALDRSLACLNGPFDPVRELFLASRNATSEMASLLMASWNQVPLPADDGREVQGSVTILWRSTPRQVRRFLQSTAWLNAPAPVLLLREDGTPKQFPEVNTPEFAAWDTMLTELFHQRLRPPPPVCWCLESKACRLLESFGRELGARSVSSAAAGGSITWMQDLAVSLAIVLMCAESASRNGGGEIPPAKVQGAILLTRWLIELHLGAWMEIQKEPCTDITDDADNPDIVAIEEDILDAIRRKGPLSRRELSRSMHQLDARTRNKVLERLLRSEQIHENGDGRLELRSGLVAA